MSLSGKLLCHVRGPGFVAILAGAVIPVVGQTEPLFTNSLGMEFVRLEPGEFLMGKGTWGEPRDNSRLDYDEYPAHRVRVTHAFYLLKDKVLPEQFRRSQLPGSASDLSWNQAAAFCVWLSRQDGRSYRLPTEAEWEYGFRQGHGLTDWAGREWVQDWYGLFNASSVVDPQGPVTGVTKVVREGAHRASLPPDAAGKPWGLAPTGCRVALVLGEPAQPWRDPPPFCQAAVKQSTAPALQGPDPKLPYFTVRFALPIPPDNDDEATVALTGLDPSVLPHNHSPGFEILPNGDALAVFFSAKNSRGASESDSNTRFVQARLRYGAEEWDPPELFCDFKPLNDQSALLWSDGQTIRFFGGGRDASPWMPFKMGISTNHAATWTMSLPYLDAPAADYTAQPIANGFRGPDAALYFAMDGAKNQSFLWCSLDDGRHWHDMGGRTGGRHSTIVPLAPEGPLLSLGGKGTSLDGWSPQNTSSDWGATWSAGVPSPFPALGGNQRPCLIRLANGHLCLVSDSYKRKAESGPSGWAYGAGCIVGISTNNARTWRIKRLPVELPHEADRQHGTLGYATVRQAPNGVLHVLTTMTHPCLHYEFNEAWVFSDAGDLAPEATDGRVQTYKETYPDGTARVTWGARITDHGRYLLSGTETSFYPNGQKEYEVAYLNGRKSGLETFWAPDGSKVWSWNHQPEADTASWVHYWHNGGKQVESRWSTRARARNLNRAFFGRIANGPVYYWDPDSKLTQTYHFTNGTLAGKLRPPRGQVATQAAEARTNE